VRRQVEAGKRSIAAKSSSCSLRSRLKKKPNLAKIRKNNTEERDRSGNSFQDTASPRGSQVPRGYHVARWLRHSDPQPIRICRNHRAAPRTPASVSCCRTVFVHADVPAGRLSGGARLCKRPAFHPKTGSSIQKGHDGTSPSAHSWCNPPRSLEEPGCLSQSSTSHATSEG
jgi:hypothetical protein